MSLEGTPQPLIDASVALSDEGRTHSIQSSSPPAGPRPSFEGPGSLSSRLKAAKAYISTPRFIALFGLVLLAISAGVIAAGIAMPTHTHHASHPPSITIEDPSRDPEGVPLDALQQPASGSISECLVELGDWKVYAAAAAAAEQQAYGLAATNMTPDEALEVLRGMPNLRVGVKFWVLDSPGHPWSKSFAEAAALQTSILDAAFSGHKLSFVLEGVAGVPATDADVNSCGKAAAILNNGQLAEGSDSGSEYSLLSRLLATVDTETVVNVVLCEPEGVNGATNILGSAASSSGGGSGKSDGPSTLDQAIVLRRGALWQSRSTLVHQLGHFLGLPHPFPDTKSCKYDADAVVDTPQQYQGSIGCAAADPLPLCDSDLELPPSNFPSYGFMDITGDSCRRQFTPGQILRARAMLSVLRPALHAAASQGLQRSERMPWAAAYQSALPSEGLILRQTASAAAANAASQGQPSGGAVAQLTSSLEQAALAAGGGGGSTALHACSCAGPDASGQIFWTGQLEDSYLVDAVRIVQPWEVVWNATIAAAANIGEAAPSPAPEEDVAAAAPLPSVPEQAASAAMDGAAALGPEVEVRLGPSPRFWENSACGNAPLRLQRAAETIHCPQATPARFITVLWGLAPAEAAFQSETQQKMRQLCLCDVAALSYVAPPLLSTNASDATFPGAGLNLTALAANQSSVATGSKAAFALQSARNASTIAAAGAGTEAPLQPVCSVTQLEERPWWSLDLGIDPVVVWGVRLAVPSRCTSLAELLLKISTSSTGRVAPRPSSDGLNGTIPALNATNARCSPPANVSLDIFLSEAPLDPNWHAGGEKRSKALPEGVRACARGIAVTPGQLVEVECGEKEGTRSRFLTIRPSTNMNSTNGVASVGSGTKGTVLELCGVQPIGAVELAAGQVLAGAGQDVSPADLLPFFSMAVDGDLSTCITAPSTANTTPDDGSSALPPNWTAKLDGTFKIVGLNITFAAFPGAAAATPAVPFKVSLLDSAGGVAWSWSLPDPSPTATANEKTAETSFARFLAVNPAVLAAGVSVSGFTSLCEVTLLGSTHEPLPTASAGGDLKNSSFRFFGESDGGIFFSRRSGWKAALSSADAASAVDGDGRSCVAIPSVGREQAVRISTTAAAGILPQTTVHILANASVAGVVVELESSAAARTATEIVDSSTSSEEAAAETSVVSCGPAVTLSPWRVASVRCPEVEAAAVAIVVRFPAAAEGTDPLIGLCEVWTAAE